MQAIDAPKRKGGLMGMIKTLLFAVILLGAGFGGGWFYFANPLSPAQDMLQLIDPQSAAPAGEHAAEGEGEAPLKVPKPVPEEEKFQTSYFTFPDPITANLRDSKRFLQVQIGVSTQYDESVMKNVETHKLALQSDMLTVLSTFSETDIEGTEGRAHLADAVKEAINARLEKAEGFGGIEDVFFPSFVLQ
ncbi:flagellar basal body protein FliL [Gemmobacter aquarius]|uniref:Flagellar protein FliL n=2 Tax=Paragemmobacter aquarius TaxID=2169400 RepID=A0A2S0URI7_9RHOB|nr:flagellar basal body protein FliL [Gemmobacter aquarius]